MNDPRRGRPSASAMSRLAKCPGSLALIESLRATDRYYEPFDPDAESGRKIHAHLAGETIELTEEEKNTAHNCELLLERLIMQWKGPITDAQWEGQPRFEFIREKRFWFRQGIALLFSGCPDLVLIDHELKRALIVNFKTGHKEADPVSENLQLRTEAVLVRANFPFLESIQACLIEPWINWDIALVRYSSANFAELENEVLSIVDAAYVKAELRVAGDWCRLCPARARCPQGRQFAAQLYHLALEKKENVLELARGKRGSEIIENIKTVRGILEALEGAYKELLRQEPDALEDHFLHPGKKRRELVQIKAVREALTGILEPEQIDACATFWVGKLESAFGKKLELKGPELAERFEKLLGPLIEVSTDEPYIDKRPKKERAKRKAIQEATEAINQ